MEYPRDKTITQLFEEQVERSPDAVAVVFEEQQLSYGELNRRANHLAHQLRKQAVTVEVRVGLFVERSVELMVGLLGILKAGGAYVPLDPGHPPERLAFMLEDAQVRVVVSEHSLGEKLMAHPVDVVWVEEDTASLDENPWAGPEAQNVAYVIYTSGSTGCPKGVLVSHWNVARLFHSTTKLYGFGAEDVWTLFHSVTFDFSVWEMWGALLYGGRLVVVPFFVSRTPEAFVWLLQQQRVTVLNQTPSAFQQLQPKAGEG